MLQDPFLERAREVRRVLLLTLLLNFLVCGMKLGYGHWTQSLSMIADGYHSLLDSASNIIGLVALLFAAKPADPGHPYGHRKIEAIAAMLISGMLFLACYEIASSAYERFQSSQSPEVNWGSFAIMLFTIVVNLWVSRYEHRRGHELHSQILTADSAHTRSDVFASISVIIALIAVKFQLWWMDLAAAALIALFVGYSGYRIIIESLNTLLDTAQLDSEEIAALVMTVSGIRKCHHIRTRGNPTAIYMDLNIHVDPELSTEAAHELAHQAIAKLKAKFPQLMDVVVHTEPNTSHED